MLQLPVLEGSPDAVQVCGCGSDPGGGEWGGRSLHEGDLLISSPLTISTGAKYWLERDLLPWFADSRLPCHQGLSWWSLGGWPALAAFAGPALLDLTVRFWLFAFMVVVGLPLLSSLDVAAVIWNKMWKGLIFDCFFQPSNATEWNSTTNVGKILDGILHPLEWENTADYVCFFF